MLGFKKKTQNEIPEADTAAEPEAVDTTEETAEEPKKKLPQKKGVPTPTRKEREAARRRPLVHNNRKAARQAQRKALQEQRAKMRRAMETGEEKYLPVRDRGPQKRYARDYVDARIGLGEWLLILMLIFLFASFMMTDVARGMVTYFMFLLMLGVLMELIWVARSVRKRLEAKYGVGNVEKGVRFYSAMRALQMRRLRLPKPMVNRGEFPS